MLQCRTLRARPQVLIQCHERRCEFDVVVVGAGPAGLAAACRLAQLAQRDGREPVGLRRREGREPSARTSCPAPCSSRGRSRSSSRTARARRAAATPVAADRVLWLRDARRALAVPGGLRPAADAQSRQPHREPRQRLPLARRAGRGARLHVLPGFAAATEVLVRRAACRGRRHGRLRRRARRRAQDQLSARLRVAREVRGICRRLPRTSRQACSRRVSRCAARADPQHYGIGLKEIWQIDPAKHREGEVRAHGRLAARRCDRRRRVSSITRRDRKCTSG